jgi:hypothetical protein
MLYLRSVRIVYMEEGGRAKADLDRGFISIAVDEVNERREIIEYKDLAIGEASC